MGALDQSASNPMLLAALNYAQRGWQVLQCRKQDKCPATRHGYKDATDNRQQLIPLWKHNPDGNVAIATGAASNLFVLDVDPRSGGTESLAELEEKHGPLPATLVAKTGGNGLHFYFQLEKGVDVATSTPVPGLDFKGRGGYVLAPPSIHPNGTPYRFRDGFNVARLASMPAWLIALATPRKRQAATTRAKPPSPTRASESKLGRLFAELSMLGPMASNGVQTVTCPWEEEHTTGRRFDTSTAILISADNPKGGSFNCKHGHCAHRKTVDAVAKLETLRNESSPNTRWLNRLVRSTRGKVENTFGNLCLILGNDPEYAHHLRLDEMNGTIVHREEEATDQFISQIRLDLEGRYAMRTAEPDTLRATSWAASKRSFHPVREYLQSLNWDGHARLHRVAGEILRVRAEEPDHENLFAQLLKRWFIGLIGRPLKPGLKLDTVLILQGQQGTGKSSFYRVIADPWFSDSPMPPDKDGMMQMAGNWISEWAELETVFRQVDVSRVKQHLSSSVDSFRAPYARTPIKRPRSGVIAGSTNLSQILRDPTGSRRFWVVPSGAIELALLAEWREQLLAEAAYLFQQGEQHWLTPEEETQRSLLAEAFIDGDPWDEKIRYFVRTLKLVRPSELLVNPLGMPPDRQTRADLLRVQNILRQEGFQPDQQRINGHKQRVWIR